MSEDHAFDWNDIPGGPPPEDLVLAEMRKMGIPIPGEQQELFDTLRTEVRAA